MGSFLPVSTGPACGLIIIFRRRIIMKKIDIKKKMAGYYNFCRHGSGL